MNRANWFCLVWLDNQRHFSLLKVPENVTDGPYKRWPNNTHQKKKECNIIYKISKDYQGAVSVPCIFLTFPQVFRQALVYVVLFIQITVSLHNQGVSGMNKSICCFFFTACCSSAQVHVSRMIHLLLFSTCLMLSWVKQSPLWAAETNLSPESGASRAPPAASTWANVWAALEQHPTTRGELFSSYFSPCVLLRRGEWKSWAPGIQPRSNLHITSAGSRPVFIQASRNHMGMCSQAGCYHPSLNFLPFINRSKQIEPHFLTTGHKNVREIFLPKLPSHKC